MSVQSDLVQGSKEWHQWRSGGIGASEVAIVLGVSPFKTRFQLWLEKCKIAKAAPAHPNAVKAMTRGTLLEPEIRAWYERKTGRKATPCTRAHPEYPFMLASYDGITDDGRNVEIKASGKADHSAAKKGKVSAKYIAQVQAQMAVAGLEVTDYVSHSGERDLATGQLSDEGGAIVEVRADKEHQQKIIESVSWFWNLVQKRTPPDVDMKDMDDLVQLLAKQQQEIAETMAALEIVTNSLLMSEAA